jgi:hypothetical protein
MSERLACNAVGLARSTYRPPPLVATPADPDAQLRTRLRAYINIMLRRSISGTSGNHVTEEGAHRNPMVRLRPSTSSS